MTQAARQLIACTVAFLLLVGIDRNAAIAQEATSVRGSYLVDPEASRKTPKYLGVCLEVADNADRSNLWDWLGDSGAKMARLVHPDKDMRLVPASEATYKGINAKADFDAFRTRLLADPENNIPWSNYRFDKVVPWLGVPDVEVKKAIQAGVPPIISMAYAPHYYPKSILKIFSDDIQAKDENVNWAAAASAYEYYLASIYRYASRDGVTHFMMLNEPIGDKIFLQQIGAMARMARQALEDVRTKLADKRTAAALRLSGPACHSNWEEFWPYVAPYVDFLDIHFYDPDPDMFAREYHRAEVQARQFEKKVAFTEFNRIGGPTPPDQALWCLKPSLQVGALTMSALSSARKQDPGCEMALFYQFQSPATHRSFKSLVYGDMNMLDWTGADLPLNKEGEEWYPSFDELQVRFATPAYHIFKMLSRCTPGAASNLDSYEVLDLGESSKGFSQAHDSTIGMNVYRLLDDKKYYALGGVGPELRTLVVRTPDRLLITVINPGPNAAKRIGFDLDFLKETYATAVVRETSLNRRDQAVAQMPVSGKRVVVDLPPEAVTQIILLKDDLSKVSELKFEEVTATPGTIKDLGLFQTTRLRALGRVDDRWLDLTELNVVWSSSDDRLVNVYQGGLVQRVRQTGKQVAISAKTLSGEANASVIVMPDKEGQKLISTGQLVPNGGFEDVVVDSKDMAVDWTYLEEPRWETGASPAKGWVTKGSAVSPWERSLERNHTAGGKACLKLQIDPANKSEVPNLMAVSGRRDGFEIGARQYQVSAWVWRPSQGGLTDGTLGIQVKYSADKNAKPVDVALAKVSDLPLDKWVEVSQTIGIPVDASRMQVHLAFTGAPGQAGAIYIDDVSVGDLATIKAHAFRENNRP